VLLLPSARQQVRSDGRARSTAARKNNARLYFTAEGSVLIELGKTRVICTASVDDGVPGFLKGRARVGDERIWNVARARKSARPRSSERKTVRRTLEIQRLIGRSLRAITDQEPSASERLFGLRCDSGRRRDAHGFNTGHCSAGACDGADGCGWILKSSR